MNHTLLFPQILLTVEKFPDTPFPTFEYFPTSGQPANMMQLNSYYDIKCV